MRIEFTKMQGSGNDFILIDNRQNVIADPQKTSFVINHCRRGLSVGADGVIFLEDQPLRWDFYNADGSTAEMCGNGARCFAVFAIEHGAAQSPFVFQTRAGTIRAELTAPDRARVQLTSAKDFREEKNIPLRDKNFLFGYFINTGVPHLVIRVDDRQHLENYPVATLGKELREHQNFASAGTNVNFIAVDNGEIWIRTFERGVEAETLACGTGAVAAAIVGGEFFAARGKVHTRGGDTLNVEYKKTAAGFSDIFLEGPALKVFVGFLD